MLKPGGHVGLLPAAEHDAPVDPGRLAASVDLRHPPHAHQRVAAGPEHQFLQAADLLQVPGPRCREDPLPQPPYVLLGLAPVHLVPFREAVLRSVHRDRRWRYRVSGAVHGVQLALRFRRCSLLSSAGPPDPRQRPFRPGHQSLSGRLCGSRWRRSQHPVPGFPLPFGRRHSLLGSSCARWGVVPFLRPAYRQARARRTPSGLSRSAWSRCGRGGCRLNPGDGGALPTGRWTPVGTCRLPAAVPFLPPAHSACGSPPNEASSAIHLRSPVRPSPACDPRTERGSLGISPGSAPCGYPQRTPGRGRSLHTGPGTTSPT